MGLGKLMTRPAPAPAQTRSTIYTALNTITGQTESFTVTDALTPDFPTLQSWYGAAMSIPGAWRAANLIADLIGQLPWHAYRDRAGNPIEQITPDPPLLDQPSPPDSRMVSFSSWALDYLWDGNAIGIIAARGPGGWPTAILPVPARAVYIRRVTPYVEAPLPLGAVEYKVGALSFGSDEVLHIKGPCAPGAIRGLGVLEAHLKTLQLADDQGRQARSISNHGVPTGVLKATNPDVTTADMVSAKAQWLANQSNRTIQALGPGTDFTPLSWNPDEMEMVDSRRFTLTELELIFGLPVGWLGGYDSARQYSNIEQDAVNLLKFTLNGPIARFEGALSMLFPRGTTVKANLDAILRADTLTRYQAHQIALTAGFLTVDEVREIEDRPPLPEQEPPPIMADAVVGTAQPMLPPRPPGSPMGGLASEGAIPGDTGGSSSQ
jgi:HK97 family phage portal protein